MNQTMNKLETLRLNMMRYHTDDEVELVDEIIQAARCALSDLQGSLRAYEQMSIYAHDWEAHKQSIVELEEALFDM